MLCMQAEQHGSMEAQDLARFTQSCLATLTVAYKQAKLSTEVGLYTLGQFDDLALQLPQAALAGKLAVPSALLHFSSTLLV